MPPGTSGPRPFPESPRRLHSKSDMAFELLRRLPKFSNHVSPRVQRFVTLGTVFGVSVLVVGALAVLPARTWLGQKDERNAVQAELDQVNADVERLDAMLDLLETDAEIERRARENFDLVYPGEESYRILEKAEG